MAQRWSPIHSLRIQSISIARAMRFFITHVIDFTIPMPVCLDLPLLLIFFAINTILLLDHFCLYKISRWIVRQTKLLIYYEKSSTLETTFNICRTNIETAWYEVLHEALVMSVCFHLFRVALRRKKKTIIYDASQTKKWKLSKLNKIATLFIDDHLFCLLKKKQ